MARYTKTEIAEARERLAFLTPGMTVRTILRHVSRSGMMRHISLGVVTKDGYRDITRDAAVVTNSTLAADGPFAIKVGGAGMDMGFSLVYGLSRTLFPTGHQCTGSNGRTKAGNLSSIPACPSNDHSNDYGTLARKFDQLAAIGHAPAVGTQGFKADDTQESRTRYVAARQAWISAQKTYTKTRTHRDGGYALRQQWL